MFLRALPAPRSWSALPKDATEQVGSLLQEQESGAAACSEGRRGTGQGRRRPTGEVTLQRTKRDGGQPGRKGSETGQRCGCLEGSRGPSLRPPPEPPVLWSGTHPACSPPAAASRTTSFPNISFREKPTLIAELLLVVVIVFNYTSFIFCSSGARLDPTNLKFICGITQ